MGTAGDLRSFVYFTMGVHGGQLHVILQIKKEAATMLQKRVTVHPRLCNSTNNLHLDCRFLILRSGSDRPAVPFFSMNFGGYDGMTV